MSILLNIAIIFAVIMAFNFIIFVHELGHFWAAKWRGMQVDRFQIWFGKPIWKKTIGGVQYGLGSFPFGGFVSLPQMAPMESIEGKSLDAEEKAPLAPITPLDKIIVAFAGPLFSFLLAVGCALVVAKVGVLEPPKNAPVIGYVEAGSPAEKAGLMIGDVITDISGEKPVSFDGQFDAVNTMIALSSGETIAMKVERGGEEVVIETGYTIPPKNNFLERAGLREIGIAAQENVIITYVMPHSPAAKAGLQSGDVIVGINDVEVLSFRTLKDQTTAAEGSLTYNYKRDGVIASVAITPEFPDIQEGEKSKMIGMSYAPYAAAEITRVYPSVGAQIKESGVFMWKSIKAVADKNTSVGIEQMSGPIGMGTNMFNILKNVGVDRLLWFLVIININLAIFNLLPFPVLDGGHIVMATYEWIKGKPLPMKFLEIVQTGFVMLIMAMFLYITLKDFVGLLAPKNPQPEVEFLPEN